MKKILPIIFIVLIIAGAAYWYFFMRTSKIAPSLGTDPQSGFSPFGKTPTGGGRQGDIIPPTIGTTTSGGVVAKIPRLRLLSNTPVGGYGASTTASTTVVRWVDRGRGNIYEAYGDTLNIETISNTVVPKIYESIWNKNTSSFIASTYNEDAVVMNVLYVDIKARILPKIATTSATSTSQLPQINTQSLTPYELKGKDLPENIIAYASSPKKDRIFMFANVNGSGVGYVSTFDGKSVTQIFTTPLTQINVEWPEDNTITITTKGTANEGGFLYFVDPKSGVWKKILGPIPGISTRVSRDAKKVVVSTTGSNKNILTSIYDVAARKGVDAIIRTLADKCVWGNFYKELVYCASPSQLVEGVYPDDWYKGSLSTIDKIWQVNSITGEISLVSSFTDGSDRLLDIFNLGLDEKDDFLFFMNKNDLSLWSLDLIRNE